MRPAGWQACRPAGACARARHEPRLGCRPGRRARAAPHEGTDTPLSTQIARTEAYDLHTTALTTTGRHAAPDDEAALHVLGAASRALAGGGSLLVVEPLLAEEGGGGHAFLEDLSLLVVGGGRDRTLREWTHLFERAGLELVGVHPAPAGGSALCGLAVLVARRRPSTSS